jgi:glycosyltransferase involved in cell wall biosynthesis
MKHPAAGGAEVVSSELGKRLAADGHEVVFLTSAVAGRPAQEEADGYTVIRMGGRYSVYWKVFRYIRAHMRDWPDVVIEEVNTIPFFSRLYLKKPRYLFFHMLCRKIWFYQMVFPLSWFGYVLEPLYLRILGNDPVITVSDSTKQDLVRHGFDNVQVAVISEGIQLQPISDIGRLQKFDNPTIISLGSLRSMKRTMHQIEAFEIAKRAIPNLQLKIAGSSDDAYGLKVLKRITFSPYAKDIEYLGRVSDQQKRELMQKGHAITVTSVKEGWGLIVTEAASQGTPAVVYDVDGLRDSVQHGRTGLVTPEGPDYLAAGVVALLHDTNTYSSFQKQAYDWSQQITFEHSYRDFKEAVSL